MLEKSEVSELASAEFHQGISMLSSLIGVVGVEDLLDEIFLVFALESKLDICMFKRILTKNSKLPLS